MIFLFQHCFGYLSISSAALVGIGGRVRPDKTNQEQSESVGGSLAVGTVSELGYVWTEPCWGEWSDPEYWQ